jgi:hypothetical protein
MTISRTPLRPTIRHRRVVRQPNRFVGPILVVGLLALLLQMYWMQRNWGEISRRTDHVPLDPELLSKLTAKLITLYECEHCLGNGLLDDPERPGERVLCAVCYGVGYHATRRYTDEDRMCLNCGGMGRLFDEHGEVHFCTRCGGRGVVELEPPAAPVME